MSQSNWLLFDEPAAKRLSRRTDPLPSHAAGAEMARSGRAAAHREQVLGLIREHPGRDVSGLVEAAKYHGLHHLDRAAISKRLSELHEAKQITTPSTGTRARKWFAA